MEDDVLDDLSAPATGLPGGSMAELMLGDWDAHGDAERDRHLCALCGNPIEDPLDECSTCAAAFENGESA